MRRKPVFLGYFAIFLVSVFASCQFLDSILSQSPTSEPNIVQETNQDEQYDRVLSPEVVATLPLLEAAVTPADSETALPDPDHNASPALSFVQVDIVNPAPLQSPEVVDVPLTNAPQNASEATATSPREISIFRTVLAVLLAVAALTLAGFGLYQAYGYFAPFIDDYLRRNYH